MGEKIKKRIIATLLLISCIISGFMLAYTSDSQFRKLENLAQADSLIVQNLEAYNIPQDHIRVKHFRVDSNFTRKQYIVSVPPGFSKTQLHAELNEQFFPLKVTTPSQVLFPQRDLSVHFRYNNTVIRTLTLRTDPGLMMERNLASLMIAFDKAPDKEIIQKIINFGEPISLVLMIEDPVRANELRKELEEWYPYISFWLQKGNGENLIENENDDAFPVLQKLSRVAPDAQVLNFNASSSNRTEDFARKLNDTGLEFINASDAFFLDAESGKSTFNQKMEQFARSARQHQHPVAILKSSENALEWLRTHLAELKKQGLRIVPVPVTSP